MNWYESYQRIILWDIRYHYVGEGAFIICIGLRMWQYSPQWPPLNGALSLIVHRWKALMKCMLFSPLRGVLSRAAFKSIDVDKKADIDLDAFDECNTLILCNWRTGVNDLDKLAMSVFLKRKTKGKRKSWGERWKQWWRPCCYRRSYHICCIL